SHFLSLLPLPFSSHTPPPPPPSPLFPYTTLFRSPTSAICNRTIRSLPLAVLTRSATQVSAGATLRTKRCRWRPTRLAIRFFLELDRKSTRLNSSHVSISYAVFCLKKKKIVKKQC